MARKILLTDDEESVITLVAATLGADEQYQLFLARDGEEALKSSRKHAPDLIILDILMPKIDGYEVCRSLKSCGDTAGIRILILSAQAQKADLHKAWEAGADDYLTKPFSPTALLEKVEDLLTPTDNRTNREDQPHG